MGARSEFRQALVDGDVNQLMRIWARTASHLPQPTNREQGEIVMHRARTETTSIAYKLRFYSHRWLTERLLPSGLPNELRPRAERMYPVIVDAVGIAVKNNSPLLKPATDLIRRAMENAVSELYADGQRDPVIVKRAIDEARMAEVGKLFGKLERATQ